MSFYTNFQPYRITVKRLIMKKRYGIYAINDKGIMVSLIEDAYTMGDCEQKAYQREGIKCVTSIKLLGHYIDGVYFKIETLTK